MENIYCRVEPLNPTVDILCSFAALGEPSMPKSPLIYLVSILSCGSDMLELVPLL